MYINTVHHGLDTLYKLSAFPHLDLLRKILINYVSCLYKTKYIFLKEAFPIHTEGLTDIVSKLGVVIRGDLRILH